MNRLLLLIASALAVFFISSCAPIPDDMVPKDTYGSLSGTLYSQRHLPHRSAPQSVSAIAAILAVAAVVTGGAGMAVGSRK